MEILFTLYLLILFIVFTPRVLFTVPVKGTYMIALLHASIFGLVYYLTNTMVWNAEGFRTRYETVKLRKCSTGKFCPVGSMCCPKKSGRCIALQTTRDSGNNQACDNGKYCPRTFDCIDGGCMRPQIKLSPPKPPRKRRDSDRC